MVNDKSTDAFQHFVQLLKSGINPLTLDRRGSGLDAHERFVRSVMCHVVHPITYIMAAPVLMHKAMPGHPDLLLCVRSDEFGRMFAPSFSNFLMSCLELFLEEFFLEKYAKSDGSKYSTVEDWKADASAFAGRHAISLGMTTKQATRWVENFSFQRARDLETLYQEALSIDVRSKSDYKTIRLLWLKRHLFTHRAGIFDQKFIDEWNALSEPPNHVSVGNVGKLAFLELQWVVDAVGHVLKFTKAVAT
jgi:hypothetical protein